MNTVKTLRAEILQIFRVNFGSNENFKVCFRDHLTFSVNCGTLNATTLTWLLVLGYKKKMKETLKAENSNA